MKPNLKVQIYILKELLSPFILSLFVFLFTILMVQAFRFTDILLMSGGELGLILSLLKNLIVSTFPIIFPLSLLAALLLGYGRLSQDSELIAFSSLGYGIVQLIFPAFLLGGFVFYLSFLSVTDVGPRGHKVANLIASTVKAKTLKTSLKPGVFVNVNDVTFYIKSLGDKKKQDFQDVFILDGRKKKTTTILSKKAQLVDSADGQATYLKLSDGQIHFEPRPKSHASVKYDQYDLSFVNDGSDRQGRESIRALTNQEVYQKINDLKLKEKALLQKKQDSSVELKGQDKKDFKLIYEYNLEPSKRLQMALTCLVFVIMGLSFGFHTFNRISRSESVGVCLGLSLVYWIVYFVFESLSYKLHASFMIYLPNIIFLSLSCLYLLYRNGLLSRKIFRVQTTKTS